MYQTGDGVLKNYFRAHMWYDISAANGYEDGTIKRDDIAHWLTTAEIEKAKALAEECVLKEYKGC